ncbi:hypothetical protein [Lysobacter capsici]|uniref:hypothetical protein n=1 Tax=Lysobacter capsici TaxID=435897 RepID=UPI001C003F54|nr:hypothetical protein [Lysobacter capsici]QWF19271.1 hypothetical protein KME82_11290 [Lysobacter capsici]
MATQQQAQRQQSASRGYSRAGISYRQCADCAGAGAQLLEHPSRDPQLEESLTCCLCGGYGFVRVNATDPLENLQAERAVYLRRLRAPADPIAEALRLPPIRHTYDRARACAMAPSRLPTDYAPVSARELSA